MVQSGLENRVSVAPERLTIHLALALFLFGSLIWCALEAWAGQGRVEDKGPWARGGLALTGLIFVQIMLGALVAGNRAGKIYNDWPMMNGQLFPKDYTGDGLWDTIAHSLAAVQFNHRMVAYVIVVVVAIFAVNAWRSRLIQPDVRRVAIQPGRPDLVSGLSRYRHPQSRRAAAAQHAASGGRRPGPGPGRGPDLARPQGIAVS